MSDSIQVRKKAANEAVWHWRWQRLTAVALIFLLGWFMVALVSKLQSADPKALATWLSDSKVAWGMTVLIVAALVHKHIGIHEIFTDYLHCPCKKKFFNLLLNVVSAGLGIATLAAVWHLHALGAH